MPDRSLTVPPSNTRAEEDVIQKLRQLYRVARDQKRRFYATWLRNYRLVNNRLGGQSASNWLPSPRDSEIYPVLASLVGWMTDQETDLEFTPLFDPGSQQWKMVNHLSKDLSDVVRSTWAAEDFDAEVKMCLWDAFIYSVGIGKAVWDNQLDGGQGNASIRRVDPWSFYPDPVSTSMKDMEYCVEVRRYSREEIIRRFPHAEAWLDTGPGGDEGFDETPKLYSDQSQAPKTNPGNIPQSGAWPGSGSAPGNFGMPTSSRKIYDPLPGYVVYEFWLKENDFYVDDFSDVEDEQNRPDLAEAQVQTRWRCIVLCNNHILMDVYADELWSHGQHPYERYAFDDLGEFYGVSLVEHLSYPQIYINRLLTALQHNAELTGNPIFLEAANSGLNRVGIINRPGQRLTLSGAAAMQNKPDWLKPPEMSGQVMELIKFWIDRMENISGLSATQKGKVPNQRSAEGTVNAAQEAAMVRVRSGLKNLEAFLRKLGYKVADLVVDFYTEPRFVAIVGESGAKTSKLLAGHHFFVPGKDGANPLKFAIAVQAGSAGPTSRAARINEADKLFALGAVDDQYVLEVRQVRGIEDILNRLYDKRQKGMIGGGAGARQRAQRTS